MGRPRGPEHIDGDTYSKWVWNAVHRHGNESGYSFAEVRLAVKLGRNTLPW